MDGFSHRLRLSKPLIKSVLVPADTSVDASVDIGPIPQGFGIAVKLVVDLPGLVGLSCLAGPPTIPA